MCDWDLSPFCFFPCLSHFHTWAQHEFLQEKLQSVVEVKHLGCKLINANFQSHSFNTSSPVSEDVKYD